MTTRLSPRSLLAAGATLSLAFVAWTAGVPGSGAAVLPDPRLDPGVDDRSEAARVIDRVITEESYFARLAFLASDALQGRDTPSFGLEVAAEWLKSEHRRMGTLPGADGDSYHQRWPYRQVRARSAEAQVTLAGPERSVTLDALEGRARGGGAFDGPLTFVANPAGPPEEGSLEGQVVVMYADSPDFNQIFLQRLNQASGVATAGGAAGSVVVVSDAFDGWAELAPRLSAATWRMGEDFAPPQVVVSASQVQEVIPGLGDLVARADRGETFTAPIQGARATGEVPGEVVVDGRPANVVAILPGSDPLLRDEFVVLSAHYDHVGIGRPVDGDSIYNGADDNGSGTVALLEVAHALSQLEEGPRRSVAFVHVSGEEKGLLGAQWFVDNPPAAIPLAQMIANINADMIGGDTHRDTLVVIGKTYSTLGPLVDEVNAGLPGLRLTTSDDLWPEQRFFFRSDQFHFMRMEIPSLFFFTGLHECYHAPCDEVERLDINKATRVARLLAHATLEVANRDERPEWNPEGLAEVRQLTGGGR